MKHPPPWLFALTGVPYGVAAAFAGQVMPNVMEQHGIKLDAIGWYSALLYIPAILQFLYAPIVDVGPRRKHWIVIMSAGGAACLIASFLMPLPDHITAFLAFAFAGQVISGLVGACNGGLMAAALSDDLRGKASGYYNMGNLAGGGLSAFAAISMIGRQLDPRLIGAMLALFMIVPSLAALGIDEPRRPQLPLREVLGQTLSDIKHVVTHRSGLTGLALCMSPVGTAALFNYFAGMSTPYGASQNLVAVVTGLGAAALNALGAFIGGYLCDRFNRRALYLASGALTALCGIIMALSPRTELTFAIGVTTYELITGFCYAAFTATVLETIGKGGRAAATQYSLFVAAGNTAITYVGLIDTRFEETRGVEGVIASDATLNLLGVVILGFVFWRLGSFGKWRHPAEPAAPPANSPSA